MFNLPMQRGRAVACGLALTMLTAVGCATDRAVINQANEVHSGLAPAVMTDPQLNSYLQAIGDRIITKARELDGQQFGPESHRKEDSSWMYSPGMAFHLVNSETLNAFTTGGEHMYIYSELLLQCRSEDELAAVMAHEYAHVYSRHVHKGMNRQYLMLGGAVLAGGAGYAAGGDEHGAEYAQTFATAALAAGQFIGMSYTRGDEAEADQLGFTFYCRAGWRPEHFGDFFQQLIDKGLDTTPEAMSDHPSLKSRVAAGQRYAAELPPEAASWRQPPVANATQFKALQARTAQLTKTTPNDEQLAKAQMLLSAFPSCVTSVDQPDQIAARKRLQQTLSGKPAAGK